METQQHLGSLDQYGSTTASANNPPNYRSNKAHNLDDDDDDDDNQCPSKERDPFSVGSCATCSTTHKQSSTVVYFFRYLGE